MSRVRKPHAHHRTTLAIGFSALLATASCSFVLDFSSNQCETAQDCADELGLLNAACIDNVCVAATDGTGGGGGGMSGGCVSNQQCVDDNDQLPYMCRTPGEECVSLLSDSCTRVFGDFTDENALVFGYLGPFDGPFKFIGDDQIPILEMFENELETFGPGLPGGPEGSRRPIVVVACDESQAAVDSVTHLVENVDVPIIVGPTFSTPLLDTASIITANNVFMLSPTASSPLILDLQDEGLIWTVDPNVVDIVPAFAAAFTEVEQAVRAAQSIPSNEDIKVAHTVSGDVVVQSTVNLVTQALTINGKTAGENGANYQRFEYGDPTEEQIDYSGLIVDITAMEPNVIILMGQAEIYQDIMAPVEDNWPMGVDKPLWITFEKQIPQLEEIAAMYAETLTRLRGVRYFRDFSHPNYQAFKIRYNSAHPMGIDPPVFQERMYDALYLAAYATLAIGSVQAGNITGSQYAAALPLLNAPGQEINVGPDDLQKGMNLLVTDQDGMDFVGTTGNFEFDPILGATKGTYEVWCMNQNFEFQNAGQFYDPETEMLTGTFDCTPQN